MKNIFQYDLHTHTSFSDGRNDLLTMLQSAESYGMAGMVFTDHAFSDVEAESENRTGTLPGAGFRP